MHHQTTLAWSTCAPPSPIPRRVCNVLHLYFAFSQTCTHVPFWFTLCCVVCCFFYRSTSFVVVIFFHAVAFRHVSSWVARMSAAATWILNFCSTLLGVFRRTFIMSSRFCLYVRVSVCACSTPKRQSSMLALPAKHKNKTATKVKTEKAKCCAFNFA